MEYSLKNQELTVKVNDLGAELAAIIYNETGVNYLWNADPEYWKRSSPVLFPLVGSLQNKEYQYKDTIYSMGQHGFARDMSFTLIDKTDSGISFRLDATEETKKWYPFDFSLEIGYQLQGNKIIVQWKVLNKGEQPMYFSIGAHPAFMCPLNGSGVQQDYSLCFPGREKMVCRAINENGLVVSETKEIQLENGCLPLEEHLFDNDALIFEGYQTQKVTLLDPDKKPYVSVTFDAPVLGVWSPAKKNAPFVCIEPWYGRCDSQDFNGTLEEREWGNKLSGGNSFHASYQIQIEENN